MNICQQYNHAAYVRGDSGFQKCCGFEANTILLFLDTEGYENDWSIDRSILCTAPNQFLQYCSRARKNLVILIHETSVAIPPQTNHSSLTSDQFLKILEHYRDKRAKKWIDLQNPKFRGGGTSALGLSLIHI